MQSWFGDTTLTRLLLQRGLGAIYLLAFWCVIQQFRPLLGQRGLLPVPAYLGRVTFREAPSLFHFRYSDGLAAVVGWFGLALSVLVVTGLSEKGPVWLSVAVWLLLYGLYLSIVNVGQTFYAFGWETMLLEAGFFAAFLGPAGITPSLVPVLALRWMLFRVELGAGLIKLRGDPCWRKLSCLYYHHETQPLPNPLSAHFHHLPKPLHRASVAFSHFVQLVAPFGLFGPQSVAAVAGCLIVVHQLALIASGNYGWLNWLTIVLAFSAFSDRVLELALPFGAAQSLARPVAFQWLLYVLSGVTVLLSIKPTLNLFSKDQSMNESYNPLHLVGSYGAFGSVTRNRYEVVLEGSVDGVGSGNEEWREYQFKGKPGDPRRRPRQWAPYQLRLDWLMWFLPLRGAVTENQVIVGRYPVWFIRFVEKLLEADRATLALLRSNPFPERAPNRVRASFYRYELVSPRQRRQTGLSWKRTYLGEYLPPRGRRETAPAVKGMTLGAPLRVNAWLAALALLLGCASKHAPLAAPAASLTAPTRMCGPNEGRPACRSATEIEALLAGPTAILGMAATPSGMQGAKLLTLRASGRWGDSVIRAKWRAQSTEDLINEPRKELAAYAVQKLFLEEDELVAPPTVAYCFPGPQYRRFEPRAKSSFDGVDCVLGFLSYWLEDVQTVSAARKSGLLGAGDGIWDARLFERDPEYRDSVSNSNLLTYLINHGDAHDEQFVIQQTPRGLRAYVVDSSIAFRSLKNPMLLVRQDWSQIQVPGLSPKSIARLQRLNRADFARLGNIAELSLRDHMLCNTPTSEPLKSDGTTMTWTGSRLRIGLTDGEIALVEARVHDLLSRSDLEKLTR